MNLNLSGKHALVCGSTQGIGKAIAMELAGLGADITLVARDEEKLSSVLNELQTNKAQNHNYICADFNDPDVLKQKVEKFLTKNGTVHILINNTGGPPAGQAMDATLEEFTRAFSNHLLCNQILVLAVLEGMKSSGYGRIINIISTSVKQPIQGLGVSNTIRGAVANWAKTLAGELGPFGITVNNVLPGFTDTPRLNSLLNHKAEKTGKSLEEIINTSKAAIPMGRFAKPPEIADAVAFLASPSASYINGINLPVDGGRLESL